MKIVVTLADILDKGSWDMFCEDQGYNPWCINEGLVTETEEVTLSETEAIKYGFLPSKETP
jgi:hypothetical protein